MWPSAKYKYMANKLLTLCIIRQGDNVLLGMKKRGMGINKWNGFGGKVEAGETIEEATMREVSEEAGITVSSVEKMGVLDFTLPNEENVWQTHIFLARDFTGTPIETDEMKPQWFTIDTIPYEHMWADDKYWMPLFLQHKPFTGTFRFKDFDTIIDQELREIPLAMQWHL